MRPCPNVASISVANSSSSGVIATYYMQSPVAFDIATYMYYSGLYPITKQEVYLARNLCDRKLQRALMQFFKPENYFEVREALIQAGRETSSGRAVTASSRLIPQNRP